MAFQPWLFFVGIGIVVVGAITGKVMQMMGMGSPVSHDHDPTGSTTRTPAPDRPQALMPTVARWRRTVGARGVSRPRVLTLVGLLAVVDPHTSGRYPTCPCAYRAWCPGCGGLRAVHDLAHGHLVTALHENVLVVLLGPALVIWWLVARHRRTPGRPLTLVLSARGTVFVLVLLVVFAVVRNLPFGAGLAP